MLLCILHSRERTGTTAYLATVQNAQISMGLPEPWENSSLPLLKRVQAGISRIRLQQGKRSSCTRSPITMHILGRMREASVASSDTNKVVVWAVAYTASGFSAWGTTTRVLNYMATSIVAVNSHTNPRTVQIHLSVTNLDI